jgi:small-conductance mechanosensitive channel
VSLLYTLVFGLALLVLYGVYLLASNSASPLVRETIQSSRIWVPAGLVLLFIHYASLAFSRTSTPMDPVVWSAGLVLLGIILDFAIHSFYRPRINDNWPEGEWFRDTLRGLAYLGLTRLAYSHITKSHPLNFGTSSAFFSVALGFILKPTLGNLIAGIILRFAQPYSLGDFVQIGQRLGVVYSIDWRSTSLKLLSGDLQIIPSSYISRQAIHNYSNPTRDHACSIEIELPASISPERVRSLMRGAISNTDLVKVDPPPEIFLANFQQGTCRYRLQFWIDNILKRFKAETEVQSRLLYALTRENITPNMVSLNLIETKAM